MINKERIKSLNHKAVKDGTCVVYWMQSSQRTECNHALEYAVERANELKKPLIVFFGIADHFLEAGERHYHFMLEGLQEVEASLTKKRHPDDSGSRFPGKGSGDIIPRSLPCCG